MHLVYTLGGRLLSLGSLKIYYWLKEQGETVDLVSSFDKVDLTQVKTFWFSCFFTWYVPELIRLVNIAKNHTSSENIHVGGVCFAYKNMVDHFVANTLITPHCGPDDRFDRQKGVYPYVFFSRGCPEYKKSCGDCPVIFMDGTKQTFNYDADPARMLYDDNLTSLTLEQQKFIVDQYRTRLNPILKKVYIASGFNVNSMTEETISIWERMPTFSKWRLALDGMDETEEYIRAIGMLRKRGYDSDLVPTYCKIGHESREDCLERVKIIIESGGDPTITINRKPLLNKDIFIEYDWDEVSLEQFARFYYRHNHWGVNPYSFHKSLGWIKWISKRRTDIKNKKEICGVSKWPYDESKLAPVFKGIPGLCQSQGKMPKSFYNLS